MVIGHANGENQVVLKKARDSTEGFNLNETCEGQLFTAYSTDLKMTDFLKSHRQGWNFSHDFTPIDINLALFLTQGCDHLSIMKFFDTSRFLGTHFSKFPYSSLNNNNSRPSSDNRNMFHVHR